LEELANKINAAFLDEVLCIWKQCRNKITKMQKQYHEKHEACNVIGVPPSSWSWYEHFHNILGGT
jgi:hypothetical protein